jgi:hypothetical protein
MSHVANAGCGRSKQIAQQPGERFTPLRRESRPTACVFGDAHAWIQLAEWAEKKKKKVAGMIGSEEP